MKLIVGFLAVLVGLLGYSGVQVVKPRSGSELEESLRKEIERRFQLETVGLRNGALEDDSPVFNIATDFEGAQFADHFPGGVFRAGKDLWIEGTKEAYAQMTGFFDHWEIHGLRVLARSPEEAVASYEVWIVPKDPTRPIPKALFLEAYRWTEEGWVLKRHHAEKVPGSRT